MAQHLALTEGRTVVVTGAASGIRLAAAKSTRSNYLATWLAGIAGHPSRALPHSCPVTGELVDSTRGAAKPAHRRALTLQVWDHASLPSGRNAPIRSRRER
jgi:NAD(P)-dependent dehydrogenase (short-subunit alcohol dehydrogenase family)